VEDRIALHYAASPAWQEVLTAHAARIREEVGALELSPNGAAGGPGVKWAGKLDGEDLTLTLRKVG
jgi:hypothetical protein